MSKQKEDPKKTDKTKGPNPDPKFANGQWRVYAKFGGRFIVGALGFSTGILLVALGIQQAARVGMQYYYTMGMKRWDPAHPNNVEKIFIP